MGIEIHTQGGTVDLFDLPTASMTAPAIADTLAKINRFNGRTEAPYSVAAHSLVVSRLCRQPEAAAWGLLHDAHEAFIGDIITPAVAFIAARSDDLYGDIVPRATRDAKAVLDRQIAPAWEINLEKADPFAVAHYDQIAVDAEMFAFFGARPQSEDLEDIDRAIEIIRSLPPSENWRLMRDLWIAEAEKLASLGVLTLPQS